MRLVTDRPTAIPTSKVFVLMGVTEDSMTRYGCLLDASNGKIYIEELHWMNGVRGNEVSAHLKEVTNDKEWQMVYKFVTEKTTILSPRKLKQALSIAKQRGIRPSGIDELIAKNYPYLNRKVDPSKKVVIPLPPRG